MTPPAVAVVLLGFGIAAFLYYVLSSEEEQPGEYTEQRETPNTYHSKNIYVRRRSVSNTITDMGECIICLNIVNASEKFIPCGGKHVFHKKCIQEWELQGPLCSRHKCPICRRPI